MSEREITLERQTDENGELVYKPAVPTLLRSVFVHGGKLKLVYIGIDPMWAPHSWNQTDHLILPSVPLTIHTVEPHRSVSFSIVERYG